jgi:hypothetical protein
MLETLFASSDYCPNGAMTTLYEQRRTPFWIVQMMPILKMRMSVNQECLDRLAIYLGGNTIILISSELLPAYLADPDWRKHHAALITLTQIVEGSYRLSSFMGNSSSASFHADYLMIWHIFVWKIAGWRISLW